MSILQAIVAILTLGLVKLESEYLKMDILELIPIVIGFSALFAFLMTISITLALKLQASILSKNIQLDCRPSEKIILSTVVIIRRNIFKKFIGVLFLTNERIVFKPRKLFFKRPKNIEINFQDIQQVSMYHLLFFLPDGISLFTRQKKSLFRFPDKHKEWLGHLQKIIEQSKI